MCLLGTCWQWTTESIQVASIYMVPFLISQDPVTQVAGVIYLYINCMRTAVFFLFLLKFPWSTWTVEFHFPFWLITDHSNLLPMIIIFHTQRTCSRLTIKQIIDFCCFLSQNSTIFCLDFWQYLDSVDMSCWRTDPHMQYEVLIVPAMENSVFSPVILSSCRIGIQLLLTINTNT